MNKKPIPFFKRFVIQNFPFIEEDFDALTNYQLFCKVVEYLNKVIGSQNEVTQQMEYVLNYFNTLDVQDEINNKLDQMAASGQLTDIIAQYLQLHGVLAFNTVSEMVNATNIVNGSICKTLGFSSYMDGGGRFYKIREITNTDVVDGVNLIAISNNNQLVAELIPDDNIDDIAELKSDVSNIESAIAKKHMVVIGDSHSTTLNVPATDGWYTIVGKNLGLTVHNYAYGGAGYVRAVGARNINFSVEVDDAIADTSFNNEDVAVVIVYGGVNDISTTYVSDLNSSCAALCDKINTNFPNATLYIVGINSGPDYFLVPDSNGFNIMYYFYGMKKYCYNKKAIFINSCYWIRKGKENTNPYYNADNSHPNTLGDKVVAINMLNAMKGSGAILSNIEPKIARYSATTGTGKLEISGCDDYLIINGNITLDGSGNGEFMDSQYLMTNFFSPQFLTITNNALTTAYMTFNQATHKLTIKGSANQTYYFRTIVGLND